MIELRPGDFFCVENPAFLGRAILLIERFWAKDNEARFSHAGIVIDTAGGTIEALWRIRPGRIDQYAGKNIIVGRWKPMTPERFQKGLDSVQDDIGRFYPFWRLPLFLIPGAAKWISIGKFTVCSELVCKFLLGAGFREVGGWKGQEPDDVADMIERWRSVELVFQGIWVAD